MLTHLGQRPCPRDSQAALESHLTGFRKPLDCLRPGRSTGLTTRLTDPLPHMVLHTNRVETVQDVSKLLFECNSQYIDFFIKYFIYND